LSDSILIRWYRLTDRIAARRERPAYREPGRGTVVARTAMFIALVCALVAVPVIAWVRLGQEPAAPTRRTPATGAAGPTVGAEAGTFENPAQLPGFGVHVNQAAGYLFSYPDAWTVSDTGGTARLVPPTGDIVMTFGMAPARGLEAASAELVEEVTRPYTDVELVSSEIERTPQGQPSLVVGGRGTDVTGEAVRFLVITIHGSDDTRAITVRFDPGSDPLESLPVIREIVASFRTAEID
jgi:hypothetical protein